MQINDILCKPHDNHTKITYKSYTKEEVKGIKAYQFGKNKKKKGKKYKETSMTENGDRKTIMSFKK